MSLLKRARPSSRVFLLGGAALWSLILMGGFYLLGREEFTPVENRSQITDFPAGSSIQLSAGKPLLLVFAHPHCPCTRATLHELGLLLSEAGPDVDVTVVFSIPEGVAPGWEAGDLWNSAAALPGVKLMRDPLGAESRRFGVAGSGQTLLYAPSGQLLFSGGITASRGHEGPNTGRSALVDLILRGNTAIHQTPAFGCSLL